MKKGFTLLELLIVIGIIAILAGAIIVAINPGRQFALVRNTQRWTNLESIVSATYQRIADPALEPKGVWNCDIDGDGIIEPTGDDKIPATPTEIGSGMGQFSLCKCLVPTYIGSFPRDPNLGSALTEAQCAAVGGYSTGYLISQPAGSIRITVSAPNAELTEIISMTR